MFTYLHDFSKARFAKHPCSLQTSKLLRIQRKTEYVSIVDVICVQGLLELMDTQNHGPFSIMRTRTTEKKENIRMMKDVFLLLEIEKKGSDITLLYISDDLKSLEEFCALAAAHAEMKKGGET